MTTVLVADDEAAIRDIVASVLENPDCRVLHAGDGEEALAIANREHPDLILLDCLMPRMDGVEAAKRLRADPSLSTVPIVLISGDSDHDWVSAARAAGMHYFLVKPFSPSQLLQKLEEAAAEMLPASAHHATR